MANTTVNTASLLTPADVAELFTTPLLALSVAAQVAEQVVIGTTSYRIPRITADPSAAWVAEGAEIPVTDAQADELVVIPSKLAGLSVITNELANDSSPAAAEAVGQGLARDCARKLDGAFFGNLAAPAPKGLGSLTGTGGATTVSAGGAWANVDPFTDAVYAAAGRNATITAWAANPADAQVLAKVKAATGSNVPLLTPDPTAANRSIIGGIPLFVSTDVPAGTIYGVPRDRAVIVLREDVQIEADASPFFTSDKTAIRARMRVGFGFPQPQAVVKITKA